MAHDVKAGVSYPLGSTLRRGAANFSVYSRHAEAIELLLFDRADDAKPSRVVALDPQDHHRTFHYWHALVPGVAEGQIYAYRARGPFAPQAGLRFDPHKVLLDPYARSVAVPAAYDREAASRPGDNAQTAMKSVVADLSRYNWEGDRPLYQKFSRTVIYELHVGGFTRHPSSGVAPELRGTFSGLIQKIPYLKELGVTAVELMPVFQFDEQDAYGGQTNYWGYGPVSFFAPHIGYSASKDPMRVLDEFRDMVKALHRANIEVILDVVYNHTAESDEKHATFCFKGLDNKTYYILQPDGSYANFSGVGNTLNANHAVVRRMILDSLRFWARDMHVDGFRFDLASILSRGIDGQPWPDPPSLWDIETDPVLSGTKLIAEAWDAAGLYQVGNFFGDHWKEWNGMFRDDVRRFVKGDDGTVGRLVSRFFGSPDVYAHRQRQPEQSINYAACHDGFTLNDVVSYNHKHNGANNQRNADGADQNFSWNCGVEGETDDPNIEALRNRQVKNFLALTLLALGTPMLAMGDEARRTQGGNNNAYCQDNEISWFDWSLLERHADVVRFVKTLIAVRQRVVVVSGDEDETLNEVLRRANVKYHGITLNQPDWSDWSHSIAFTARAMQGRLLVHTMMNAYWEPLTFEVPQRVDGVRPRWRRWLDTARESPHDICMWGSAEPIGNGSVVVQPRSIVALLARSESGEGSRVAEGASPA